MKEFLDSRRDKAHNVLQHTLPQQPKGRPFSVRVTCSLFVQASRLAELCLEVFRSYWAYGLAFEAKPNIGGNGTIIRAAMIFGSLQGACSLSRRSSPALGFGWPSSVAHAVAMPGCRVPTTFEGL